MTFDISTSAWPASGTATAGTTGFNNVGSNWNHGSDADGNYVEHDGTTTTTDVINPIAEATVSSFLNGGGNQVYRQTFGFKVDGGDGSSTPLEFNAQFFWFSGTMLYLRHVSSDNRFNEDGSISHVRLYLSTGTLTHRNSGGYIFLPTNKLVRMAVEVEETTASSVFTYRYYINGECVGVAENISITAATAARVVEFRSVKTGTGPEDAKIRLYGNFVGEEDPSALYPSSSDQTSPGIRALPVSLDSATGWWEQTGTVTPSSDVDQLNSGGGTPQIQLLTSQIDSGGSIRTRSEVGALRTSGGAGALVIPALEISAGTAQVTIDIEAPGGSSSIAAIRFDTDGFVKAAAGSGVLLYTTLVDQDGANVTWTTGKVYEAAVHFSTSGKPSFVLHNRTDTFAGGGATQTITAASLTASSTGIPTLGDVDISVAGTGNAKVPGIWLMSRQVLAGVSSWTHSTGSPYGGGAHLLQPVNQEGLGLGWGNEMPGLEPDGDQPNELSALGRSGADLADWETNNPAWADLLPLMPAARFFWADTMVNHIVAQRLNGETAINTAASEVLDQVGRFIDAAKAYDIKADFMTQQPLPTGGTPNSYNSFITAACVTANTGVKALLDAAGRRDLFTWADIIAGQVESDFYNTGTDDTHYDTAGDELALLRSYTERAPVGDSAGGRMFRSSEIDLDLDDRMKFPMDRPQHYP